MRTAWLSPNHGFLCDYIDPRERGDLRAMTRENDIWVLDLETWVVFQGVINEGTGDMQTEVEAE